jgi:hypothetical protein
LSVDDDDDDDDDKTVVVLFVRQNLAFMWSVP